MRMNGGLFIAQGADTCVYDPPVECKAGTQSPADIPPGDYVSRLVVKNDNEINNQIAVRTALGRLQREFPDADILSHFNLAAAKCEPELKESDLKNAEGKYCRASQRVINDVSRGPTYANLITPRQQDDMHKLPVEFNRAQLPGLLHAVAYLNSVDIVHSDAHAGNIAKMGDKLVLHDWGRTLVGLEKFKTKMKYLLEDSEEREYLHGFVQWRFPCELLDKCIMPNSNDATFLRFMRLYDLLSILGSVETLNNTKYKGNPAIDPLKLRTAVAISSNLLFSNIDPKEMLPYVHAVIDSMFSDALPEILQPYKPTTPVVVPSAAPRQTQTLSAISSVTPVTTPMPTSPPPVRRNVPRLALPPQAAAPPPPLQLRRPTSGAPSWGSARASKSTAKKLCKCIKSVRKTIKARPGVSKEKGAIAICVKSVVQKKRSTLKKFKCGKKPSLITQRRKKVGGATPVPDDVAWERFYQAYDQSAQPYDRAMWGALQSSNIRYIPESNAAKVFLGVALLDAVPELIDIMHKKGVNYAEFLNRIDELRKIYPDSANTLDRSKEIVQKYNT